MLILLLIAGIFDSYESTGKAAVESGKPFFVMITMGEGCAPCIEMKKTIDSLDMSGVYFAVLDFEDPRAKKIDNGKGYPQLWKYEKPDGQWQKVVFQGSATSAKIADFLGTTKKAAPSGAARNGGSELTNNPSLPISYPSSRVISNHDRKTARSQGKAQLIANSGST